MRPRKKMSSLGDIISVDDICAVLGIGRNTAYKLLQNQDICNTRMKRKYIIPRRSLEKYIENIGRRVV